MLFLLAVTLTCLFTKVDASSIEEGLRCLFFSDFGYTLLEVKPVSQSDNLSSMLFGGAAEAREVLSFLKITFQHSNRFIIRTTRSNEIELVSTAELLRQIKSCGILRKFIMKKFGSAEMFVQSLRKSNESLASLLNYNSILIGICFGYGEQNSNFYVRRRAIGTYLKKFPFFTVYPFDDYPDPFHISDYNMFVYPDAEKSLFPSDGFDSLQSEWEWIKSVEIETEDSQFPQPPFEIMLPGYAAMWCDESMKLYNKYLRARDVLADLFYDRKFGKVLVEEASK